MIEPHLKVNGKGGKVRYRPLHPMAAGRIPQYLESSTYHLADRKMPLFIPLRGKLTASITMVLPPIRMLSSPAATSR
jgi:site-specific recombinase XerD